MFSASCGRPPTSTTTKRHIDRPATRGQLAVHACSWYLTEVNNGGHSQFFYNSTGMVWDDAFQGFELSGATEHRQILAEALARFPASSPAKAREKRCSQIPDPENRPVDELDERLYALEVDFDILAAKYILAHPEEFFENP
jgi:hypothetical protein